jgi:hypothetical protein
MLTKTVPALTNLDNPKSQARRRVQISLLKINRDNTVSVFANKADDDEDCAVALFADLCSM